MSPKEELFIKYWEQERQHKALFTRQIMPGLRIGLLFSTAILLLVFSGWYERAQMELNAKTPAWLLIVGVLLLACFCSVFYQKFQWEQQEQQYQELLARRTMQEPETKAP